MEEGIQPAGPAGNELAHSQSEEDRYEITGSARRAYLWTFLTVIPSTMLGFVVLGLIRGRFFHILDALIGGFAASLGVVFAVWQRVDRYGPPRVVLSADLLRYIDREQKEGNRTRSMSRGSIHARKSRKRTIWQKTDWLLLHLLDLWRADRPLTQLVF